MYPTKIKINESIFLSPLEMEDAERIVFCLNDIQVSQWMAEVPYPYFIEDAKAFILRGTNQENSTEVVFAIRNNENELVGVVRFIDILEQKARINYWIANPYWGKGIMAEVIKKVCDFGIQELMLSRIYGHVLVENLRAARVLEKCGFTCEGMFKKSVKKNEKFFDCKLYALVVEKIN